MSERAVSPANPGALGLAGFGLTTLILNLVNAEIVPAASLGMVLPVGVFFGGMAQFMAGMWTFTGATSSAPPVSAPLAPSGWPSH